MDSSGNRMFGSGSALGAGFQLYTEGSAEALGQAGAISGRDDLISLAWYNPSALAGAERPAIMAGATFASIKTDYDSGNVAIPNAAMSDDWRAIPHLYYVQPISEDWTTMLSINAPIPRVKRRCNTNDCVVPQKVRSLQYNDLRC